ncbi:MAG: hypothetical protein ACTTJZ_00765 [Sphaerochaetaceae bacterium]
MDLWRDYRRFGLPHGCPENETADYMAVISIFEDEYEAYTAELTAAMR